MVRNAYINFIGQGIPILVAVLAIPLLINALGTERFGVLSLVWVVMMYFGLFDFGLGRATTRSVAEYHARNDMQAVPELVWSSLAVHAVLGLFGGVLLACVASLLTNDILNIPVRLQSEARTCFYILAVSIPFLVVIVALRGVLEAVQRFDLITIVNVPASAINYLGPLAILYFVDNLVGVVGVLAISRCVR